ncbi:MAG: DegV family protein [Lachnospiraceae bacterium]
MNIPCEGKRSVVVVTDSNSGITQKQGEEYGIRVIPMPFMIDGQVWEEDIDLTHEMFYEKLENGSDLSTSQPTPARIMELWDELLEEYEEIVHIPMSVSLSGAYQTAVMLADDYDGKVQVVNNQRISVTQRQSALDAVTLAELGWKATDIKDVLERTKMDSSIYITVSTLKYLKKGGRITPAAAALGTLLKIKPVLQIQGGKLDTFSKARTMKQAKGIMLSAIAHDLQERFDDPEAEQCWLGVAHSDCEEFAAELAGELRELYPKASMVYVDPLSLSVSCHIGPGGIGVTCTKKLDVGSEIAWE